MNGTLTKRTHGFQVSQTLLMPGWYRVTTMLFGSDSLAQFSHAYSWTMQINTTYWNQTNMSVTLLFNMAWQKYQVTTLGKTINMQQITKIRVSRNTANNVVIDIYYVYAYQNFVNIAIDNIRGGFINSFSSDVFAIESLQAVADTDLTTLIEYEIM